MADVVLKRHCKLLSFFTIIIYRNGTAVSQYVNVLCTGCREGTEGGTFVPRPQPHAVLPNNGPVTACSWPYRCRPVSCCNRTECTAYRRRLPTLPESPHVTTGSTRRHSRDNQEVCHTAHYTPATPLSAAHRSTVTQACLLLRETSSVHNV